MIVIICAKYKNNPSRTVDATEQTRFSKSRPNDLEDIGQGQGSSQATHPLMLLIICTKYGKYKSAFQQFSIICYNYTNPGYGFSLVDTLWNAGSYRQPLEQEGNPMT